MKFEDSKLPAQPDIEKAFAVVNTLHGDPEYPSFVEDWKARINPDDLPNDSFAEGLWEARFLADHLSNQNPVAIAAALAAPSRIETRRGLFTKTFEGLTEPVKQAVDKIVAEADSNDEDGLQGLAMLAFRVHLLQSKFTANLANRSKIPALAERWESPASELFEQFDTTVESLRGKWLGQVMTVKDAVLPLTTAFKDSEPKLVDAFNGIVNNAVKVLSPMPDKPAKTTANAPTP